LTLPTQWGWPEPKSLIWQRIADCCAFWMSA